MHFKANTFIIEAASHENNNDNEAEYFIEAYNQYKKFPTCNGRTTCLYEREEIGPERIKGSIISTTFVITETLTATTP